MTTHIEHDGSRLDDYDLEYMITNFAPFTKDDVEDAIACIPGEADGANWHYILKLKNGKYSYGTGWCDYSGWGCQDNAVWSTPGNREQALLAAPERDDDRKDIRTQLRKQIAKAQPYGLFITTPQS